MISVTIKKKLKLYKGEHILHVNHQFAAGGITKIYGPSGAGKTTLLKIIAGLIQPDQGKISVGDQTWLDTSAGINLPPQKRINGFVFQDYALFPNMTVAQHLAYATNDEAWLDRLLKLGRLDAHADHRPLYLSGGQQQRLAILRALAIKPGLLLMDEPFSALDPETKHELINDLKSLFGELNATALIVTHNPHELAGLADDEFYIA